MIRKMYGVDFGTSNIKLYNSHTKDILNEKNILAIKNKTDIFAVGDDAFEMYEKSPDNINVFFPIKNGVIAKLKDMESLFEKFFIKCNYPKIVKSGRFLIAVPTDITDIEKKAFFDVIDESHIRSKEIRAVQKPIADAVGVGIDMDSPNGNMIVNMGAETTEISVISYGGIVISRIIHLGGNSINENIMNNIKRKYNILIGFKTAEEIKKKLADAMYDPDADDDDFTDIYGRNIITGLPSERTVSSELVYDAIESFTNEVVVSIQTLLERIPPELSSDIKENGIYLTGGSSLIKNMNIFIENKTGLKINRVRTPEESVVRGIARIIADTKYRKFTFSPVDEDM